MYCTITKAFLSCLYGSEHPPGCGCRSAAFLSDAPRHVDAHHAWDGGTQRPVKPDDYGWLMDVLNGADNLRKGPVQNGHQRLVASKVIAGETFRAVFEVRPGKRNRALALVSLVIKTTR